ncbi:cupin domain-containing protein [Sphingopyxis macrogoltabida]|uniref:Uncharacterized protein n=1 Tax=Sphingopyxis macrogoltabida TaxID=33050 RepID=A0AAC9FHR3_SPHMC|nr:hypothetical protein [Sphingopyxis macrogoltabida]ALJ16381.1 hypothetical protein LH19_26635 [Sphingopyxis macrogoltabida]AMU92615.1 hypothetical protein ATM17_30620 [Sphingopyxis macrogoltabida]
MMAVNNPGNLLRRWEQLPFIDILRGIRICVLDVVPGQDAAGPVLVCLQYPPAYEAPAHWHTVAHIEVVLSGTLYVGEMVEPEGSVRMVGAKVKYGPLSTRNDGCKVLEIFPNGSLEAVAGHDGEPGAGWLAPEVIEIGNLIGLK